MSGIGHFSARAWGLQQPRARNFCTVRCTVLLHMLLHKLKPRAFGIWHLVLGVMSRLQRSGAPSARNDGGRSRGLQPKGFRKHDHAIRRQHRLHRSLAGPGRFRTPQEFTDDFLAEWVEVSPDVRITDPRYIDAGQTVVCTFTIVGRHDGRSARSPLPARSAT